MIDRTPTPRAERPALPAFEAVPRRTARHDGWTPERQVAFIESLADCGSVKSAAAQVNMSSESAYALRRAPGAAGFARAWEAALDMGVLRLKDEAFERALHGELVPIVSAGQILGYRRKRNDYLLMFLLRHYGEDARGRRVAAGPLRPPRRAPVRAHAHRADAEPAPESLPAPTADPTLPLPAPPAEPSSIVADFAGVPLDEEAQAQIVAILTACAARRRDLEPVDDPAETHVPPRQVGLDHPDAIHQPGVVFEDARYARDGDEDWRTLDLPDQRDAIAAAVAEIAAKKASGEWDREMAESRARYEAKADRKRRFRAFLDSGAPLNDWKG